MKLFYKKYFVFYMILCISCATFIHCMKTVAVVAGVRRVPVIMYHSVVKDEKGTCKYIISQKTLEDDLQFLKQKGYTTLFASELAELFKEGKEIPQKCVLLTFDDGFYNSLAYVLPLLEKYDMKAVVSVVVSYAEKFSKTDYRNPKDAYLGFDDIKELYDSGRVEIANHSYNMHRQVPRLGAMQIKGESDKAYHKVFTDDLEKSRRIIEENCGISMVTYTYPYGKINSHARNILKEQGYVAIFNCCEKVNLMDNDEACLSLGRFNRPCGIKTEDFMRKLGIR